MQPGAKFHRLTAVRFVRRRGRCQIWLFACQCGSTTEVETSCVTRKGTKSVKSCGCLRKELARTKRVIHGLGKTPEYLAWQKAKRRCKSDPYYLKREIKFAEVWANDPVAFINHVGVRPSTSHTLDRIDNDRGYEPGNVRWATMSEQKRNTSRNIWVTLNDVRLPLCDACKITGVLALTAQRRVRRGWSPERAIFP